MGLYRREASAISDQNSFCGLAGLKTRDWARPQAGTRLWLRRAAPARPNSAATRRSCSPMTIACAMGSGEIMRNAVTLHDVHVASKNPAYATFAGCPEARSALREACVRDLADRQLCSLANLFADIFQA